MRVQTNDFVDVAARAREFGCKVPVGVALLSGDFSTASHAGEFHYHAATRDVRSAWQTIGLEDEGPAARDTTSSAGHDRNSPGIPDRVPSGIQGARKVPVLPPGANNTSADVPLVVFFGAALLADQAWRVTGALGMVSSVFASRSRYASPSDVQLEVVVERPGERGCACIEYQGDAFGIVALVGEVRRIWPDSQWQEPRQISGLPR